MNIRTITAMAAALALSASCLTALPASAEDAVITVPYTESEGSLATGDNGRSLRRNIYNIWGNTTEDISENTAVNGYLTVTFEISGIGEDSELVNEEEGTSEPLYAFLGGSIAGKSYHQSEYNKGTVPEGQSILINGDGEYSLTWPDTYSSTVNCLYIQTNINFYAYGEAVETVADTTANIKVLSITTAPGLGDANADGSVNASDAAQVLISAAKVGAGGEATVPNAIGDVNTDDVTNASDAALILQYAAAVGASAFEGSIAEYLAPPAEEETA